MIGCSWLASDGSAAAAAAFQIRRKIYEYLKTAQEDTSGDTEVKMHHRLGLTCCSRLLRPAVLLQKCLYSSQIRIRLGCFVFEITEAGASTFQCIFFFFVGQSRLRVSVLGQSASNRSLIGFFFN